MSGISTWADYLSLRGRYQRSVHLERDSSHPDEWLGGYLPTPMVASLATRMVTNLQAPGANRAWSLTGPYGTGKSAFALFLSTLVRPSSDEANVRVRSLLKKESPELYTQLFGRGGLLAGAEGIVPVVATGERMGLEHIFLRALLRTANEVWAGRGSKPALLEGIEADIKALDAGQRLPPSRVVGWFEQVAAKLATSKQPGTGLLVILDEAGKALEYVASEPSKADLHLLQELAEAAQRSGEHPIALVVVLHQSFEHYAGRLSAAQRNEWAKVQGRFENLVFREANEQMLRLAGRALGRKGQPASISKAWLDETCRETAKLVSDDSRRAADFRQALEGVLPLHPVTAAAIAPLFRSRLSQNERSLFAFLAASEPAGLREFVALPLDLRRPSLFTLDMLYDYVASTLGDRMVGSHGRVWARVETALHRLPADAGTLDARLLKTIGVLSAIADEQRELRPSLALLRLALTQPKFVDAGDVDASLERLRGQSLIVFRKYLDSFQLWEGSDLDLDALTETARSEVGASHATLLARMQRVAPPRPLVARRHFFETGTLRHFDVKYVDETIVSRLGEVDVGEADGLVLIVIPSDFRATVNLELELGSDLVWVGRDAVSMPPVVVAVPQNSSRLRELSHELAALEYVMTTTTDLRDDPVARTQLAARITDAERQLQDELSGVTDGHVACRWHTQAGATQIASTRALSSYLSGLVDDAYAKAPIIHNELLNRRSLSGASSGARRELITAMLLRSSEPRFGIEGSPPELSMYRSVLESSGLHKKDGEGFRLVAPGKSRGSRFEPAWAAAWKAMARADGVRLTLEDVYAVLRRPPFGMREGVLPLFVVALVLVHQNEIAIYEDGRFVPQITPPLIERLLKAPSRIEVQHLGLQGARRTVVDALSDRFGLRDEAGGVLELVRHMVRIVGRLPAYAKNTRKLSPTGAAVREALLRAKEPGTLLFRGLPEACGLEPLESRKGSPEEIRTFVSLLDAALIEIDRAYPRMLEDLVGHVRHAFGLPAGVPELRKELAARASRIRSVAVDTKLKAFIVRASDDTLEDAEWLVSVGTLLGGKPPEQWHDDDLERARMNVGLIARQFASVESLTVASATDGLEDGTRLIRIAIVETGAAEHQRIVAIRPADEPLVRGLAQRVRETVRAGGADLAADQILSVLAVITRELIEDLESDPDRHSTQGSPK